MIDWAVTATGEHTTGTADTFDDAWRAALGAVEELVDRGVADTITATIGDEPTTVTPARHDDGLPDFEQTREAIALMRGLQ